MSAFPWTGIDDAGGQEITADWGWQRPDLCYQASVNLSNLTLYLGAGLTLVGTFFGLVSAVLANRANDAAQRRTDEAIAESKERIAAAESSTARARHDAAEANKASEQIRHDNLILQRTIERERVSRLRLESSLRSRTLEPDQASRLQAELAKQGLQGILITALGDGEAGPYADQIARIVSATGLLAGINRIGMMSPPPYGLIISGKQARELASALHAAGISIASVHADDQQTEILVGLKPPPKI